MESDNKFWLAIAWAAIVLILGLTAICASYDAHKNSLVAQAANPLEYACAISSQQDTPPACLVLRK